jgi:coenzyme PQQ synthesis protein D (PqqD)
MVTSHNPKGPVTSTSVRETASEDGAVLLDVEQGVCFSLNSLGLRIWELLKKGYNVDQIVIELEKHYTVSRTQLLEDVHKFMDELESRKLLLNPKANNAREDKKGFFTRLWRRRQSA